MAGQGFHENVNAVSIGTVATPARNVMQATAVSPVNKAGHGCAAEESETPCTGVICIRVDSESFIGQGAASVVQVGVDTATGRRVAVKRLQCDPNCPICFVDVHSGQWRLHCEGLPPVHAELALWSGPLVFSPSNAHAAAPFAPGSARESVVVVRRGGGASFERKALHAKAAGATGMIVVNTRDSHDRFSVGDGPPPLPTLLVAHQDGEAVISEILSGCRAEDSESDLFRAGHVVVRTDKENEMSIMRELPPHQNVVAIIAAWEEKNAHFLVTEFCAGGHLPRACDERTAARLAREVLLGVAHLHAHGVCHRDLKWSNFMLSRPLGDADARVVMIDLGMASRAERMMTLCGSLHYVAPEILGGRYGRECDIWSCGALLCEVLFGHALFEGCSDREVYQRLLAPDEVSLPQSYSASSGERDGLATARDLLASMLRKDPAARPTAVDALSHAWFQDHDSPM